VREPFASVLLEGVAMAWNLKPSNSTTTFACGQ
jgi:hypothetical protein